MRKECIAQKLLVHKRLYCVFSCFSEVSTLSLPTFFRKNKKQIRQLMTNTKEIEVINLKCNLPEILAVLSCYL